MSGAESQRIAAEARFANGRWEKTWTLKYQDPFFRFLRHRRLRVALQILADHDALDPAHQNVLVICGGIGEEGILLGKYGFSSITVTDISEKALEICREHNRHLQTAVVNAEDLKQFEDESYDIVVVQDGLHHLQRPVQGFTEMLRVARRGVVVIEPHRGAVGSLFGTRWERDGDAVNYVFRWDRSLLEQATHSYLQREDVVVICRRLWDHAAAVSRVVDNLPRRARLPVARGFYATLAPVHFAGNMMVGVVVKSAPSSGSEQLGLRRGTDP